ncbi:hypothetical protein JOD29_003544 [Lysinibacillus composti]|uniref:Uncharacterized protein n=1 Tax=Lysinibacillus composti TaxID=720633 RepID=A0A3N9UPH1_9BACI|nr:hypothetical protein [Lysinibacillus composti]MBM7610265.1 hypothetical protein [Lysinibacillus composti]RQW73816.1 hypothetical protein EBB45_14685 [Lysinibacillus composti]
MKKKWKYILLVFVLLLVAIGGYALYVFKFKEYDVADPEVDEIIEETYTIELPDGTELVVNKDGKIVEEKKPAEGSDSQVSKDKEATAGEEDESKSPNTSTSTGKQNDASTSTGSSKTPNSTTGQNSKPTVGEIKAKYTGTFQSLQGQAESKINGLIGQAASEYSSKKANGESISVGYFYSKYVGAANSLEASTDATFNTLISVIEQDLEANGYDKSYAQSFRDEYEATKEARRNALLSKAKEMM